jgi:PAS domain S-box-containing protein
MLNQAETHLAALIESSEDLIWAVDLNYRLTTFNSALSKHVESNFGVQVEVGMDFLHLHSSEKVVLWTPFYERALSEGTFRTEYSLLFRSTLELTFNPIVIEGKPTGVSVFGRDVTQRKVTEESGRLTAGIVESSDDAIHAANLDGIVVGWNHGAEVLLDYKKEEILGKCISILAPPGRGGEVPQLLDLIEKGGAISPFDTVLRRKDGCDIDVSLSLSPIRDSGGNIVGVSAIARDIGDRKRAAQALVDSEATLRRFFEQNSSVMFLVDPSSGAIVSANRAAANYYGLPQEKLIGLPTGSISDSPPEESERRIQQVLCGERRVFSYRIRLASGEERDIETHSSRIDVDGLPRLFVILHDVSERKRAEESLRESEELLQDAQRIAGFGSYVLDIPAEVWTSSDLMDEIYGIDKNYLRTLVGWTALIHPDDRAIVNAYFAGEVLSKGNQFDK